jgi:Raf kinase inhibitor-like YbhB/YbcL family protein
MLVACGQTPSLAASINVTSAAFKAGGPIPARYTCGGDDVSPPLGWSGAPGSAKSLALTVIDPDAPGRPFTHWVVFNMPATTTGLPEGGPPPPVSAEGRNDFGGTGYRGPCPPPGSTHHYHFKVYGLDATVALRAGASEQAFEDAIRGHVLATGELVGTFKR